MIGVGSVAVTIPFGIVFIFSGLLINLIRAICLATVRPESKRAFRKMNGAVGELLWLQLVWLMECWAGLKIELHTDPETYELMGKEHALFMPNHPSDVDILTTWLLARRVGCLRSALMVLKKSFQYLPIFGWATWFSEFVFLDRRWDKDEGKLKDCPRPFWLTIFVEGTRMNPEKLKSAQDFATLKGLPLPMNCMIPRTKGFVSAVKHMRSFVPALYDVKLAIPKGQATPSLLRLLDGQPSVVKVHVKRYPMEKLPDTDASIAQWCRDKFAEKDEMLDQGLANGRFKDEGDNLCRAINVLTIWFPRLWSCILSWDLRTLPKLSPLSTWEGTSVIVAGLACVAMFVHVLIEYSKPSLKKPGDALDN
ncbi:hypothetical protein BT93_J0245 [Corymbia citriodora subsp. variegata]|nr:hypothetical protein BT93_J0245 [Corymbia citriodora subsp. variegata]